jgi:ribose transport system ATP-binding protein
MTIGGCNVISMRAERIHKHYDGVRALRGADFSLAPGEVHALMGENGAGKSTLAKIIAGSVRADSGQISIDNKPVEIRNPQDAQRLGIGMIYQELDLFPSLTVAENIDIARPAKAQPFLDQVGLRIDPKTVLGSLRSGEMQLVAIARALASNARILLMDEPTSSLFDDAVERLFQLIADLKQRGVAIAYVSHRMDEIFRICDRATVLRDGVTVGTRVISETTPDELIRMMVGRDIGTPTRKPGDKSEPLLSVASLSTKKLQAVSFDLHKGEVLGIAGLVGAGRSEIGAALFGLDHRQTGVVRLNGREIHPRSPSDAIRLGIALLPEDRKREGLMMQMSSTGNAALGRFSSFGMINRADEAAALAPLFQALGLKAASTEAPVSSLSGGNQQKVLIARCLLANPDVLLLDDPTRGIDVGAKQEIYAIIDKLKSEGKGVILVSSELPELLHLSDRILVMREGQVTATYSAADTSEERIMRSATL